MYLLLHIIAAISLGSGDFIPVEYVPSINLSSHHYHNEFMLWAFEDCPINEITLYWLCVYLMETNGQPAKWWNLKCHII